MAARSERSGRRVAGHLLVAALVALALIPAYLAVPLAWRPAAMRLACALAAAAACARAVRFARRARGPAPASALDARPAPPAPAHLDPRFVALCEDLRISVRSRRYFDVILWPRLTALAAGRLERPAPSPGLRRRGPSLREIERLVANVEGRP